MPGAQMCIRDSLGGDLLDVVFDLGDHLGIEGGRHDPTKPRMARVVGGDHPAEVIEHLLGEVEDGERALAGAVDLGVPADLQDVGVPGDGPKAGPRCWGQDRLLPEVGLLEMREGTLTAQRAEGTVACRQWELPKVQVGKVDLVE